LFERIFRVAVDRQATVLVDDRARGSRATPSFTSRADAGFKGAPRNAGRYGSVVPPTSIIITETDSPDPARFPWLRPALVAPWWEIAAVFILTQGHYIYGGARIFMRRISGAPVDLRLTDYRAMHLMGGESAILGLLLVYLHWRGWTPKDLKITFTIRGFSQGILLGVANLIVFMIGRIVIRQWRINFPLPRIPASFLVHPHISHLSWASLLTSQVINALFEEVICMSYAFNQFAAKRGPMFALALMLLLRASYHTWKSPAYLVVTLFAFSLYGLWYWRTKNVWPLIVAHTFYDLFVIAPEVR
jgi:membrane protease YdiL (CAAX protease family)